MLLSTQEALSMKLIPRMNNFFYGYIYTSWWFANTFLTVIKCCGHHKFVTLIKNLIILPWFAFLNPLTGRVSHIFVVWWLHNHGVIQHVLWPLYFLLIGSIIQKLDRSQVEFRQSNQSSWEITKYAPLVIFLWANMQQFTIIIYTYYFIWFTKIVICNLSNLFC